MNEFWQWFMAGIRHILNMDAMDHILFVSLLTLAVPCCRWGQLILLLSAFTLGHFASMCWAFFFKIPIQSHITEILIALTITAGSLHAIWSQWFQDGSIRRHGLFYLFIFVFGLIHGLGFAQSLMQLAESSSFLLVGMLGFNVGVELGQLFVAFLTLVLFILIGFVAGAKIHFVKISFFLFILFCSLYLVVERI